MNYWRLLKAAVLYLSGADRDEAEAVECLRVCLSCPAREWHLIGDLDWDMEKVTTTALTIEGVPRPKDARVVTCGPPGVEREREPDPTCGCLIGAQTDGSVSHAVVNGRHYVAAGRTTKRHWGCPRGLWPGEINHRADNGACP